MPESALQNSDKNNVMVEGIAQSQARVEVRQSGALIYSTAVPGGPFALTDLPLLSGVSDLEVSVTEANGAQRRFTVPAASLHNGLLGSQRGYSLAVGKLRSLGNSNATPAMDRDRQRWLAAGQGQQSECRHHECSLLSGCQLGHGHAGTVQYQSQRATTSLQCHA